jgi:hypothetical protein
MKQVTADKIREFANRTYVEAARKSGLSQIAIRASDVHAAMKPTDRMPLVCSGAGGLRPGAPTDKYDPFVRGRFPAGVRTIQAHDAIRDRLFPCEIWCSGEQAHAFVRGLTLCHMDRDTGATEGSAAILGRRHRNGTRGRGVEVIAHER